MFSKLLCTDTGIHNNTSGIISTPVLDPDPGGVFETPDLDPGPGSEFGPRVWLWKNSEFFDCLC